MPCATYAEAMSPNDTSLNRRSGTSGWFDRERVKIGNGKLSGHQPASDWLGFSHSTAKRISWEVFLSLSFFRMLALCTATVLTLR